MQRSKAQQKREEEQRKRAADREKAAALKLANEEERKIKEAAAKAQAEEEARVKAALLAVRHEEQRTHYSGLIPAEIRPSLLSALRKVTLAHDDRAKEVILVHLLRNLLHHNLYQEADLLVSNTKDTLAQPFRSNNQMARYFYYLGRIKLVQLSYNEAHDYFQQALRKSPDKATGFKTIVTKMDVVVQLLLGEIPPRSTFRQPESRIALHPYLQLTSSVRFGQLNLFAKVVNQFADVFKKDNLFTIVQRVRQNVIKTGLRRVMHAYTKISITNICEKLELDYSEDAEYIVSKAIRDGVLEATIDHDTGIVLSMETQDVYSTPEPASAFHRRIHHLTETHNQAVIAMRYMPTDDASFQPDLDREKQQEALELALEEDDDDMDM